MISSVPIYDLIILCVCAFKWACVKYVCLKYTKASLSSCLVLLIAETAHKLCIQPLVNTLKVNKSRRRCHKLDS